MHHHLLEELDEKPSFNMNEHKQELEKLREEKQQQIDSIKKRL